MPGISRASGESALIAGVELTKGIIVRTNSFVEKLRHPETGFTLLLQVLEQVHPYGISK
jgi:hypothetical protein